MKYIGVKEAASKWGISDRRVRILCEQGRVQGAIKLEWSWTIPSDSPKPSDGRFMRKYKNHNMRLGSIDLTLLDSLKKDNPLTSIMSNENIDKILKANLALALSFSGINYKESDLNSILNGKVNTSYTLKEHLFFSNFISTLKSVDPSDSTWDISRLLSLNSSFLQGIDDSNRGRFYSLDEEVSKSMIMESVFTQAEVDYKNIHPIYKAIILFVEIMRNKPFYSYNEAFSIITLNSILRSNGYLYLSFSSEMVDEIKAALSLTFRRGQLQDLARIVERSLIKSYNLLHV